MIDNITIEHEGRSSVDEKFNDEIEKELIKRGKSFTDTSLEEMNAIWNQVKKKAHA